MSWSLVCRWRRETRPCLGWCRTHSCLTSYLTVGLYWPLGSRPCMKVIIFTRQWSHVLDKAMIWLFSGHIINQKEIVRTYWKHRLKERLLAPRWGLPIWEYFRAYTHLLERLQSVPAHSEGNGYWNFLYGTCSAGLIDIREWENLLCKKLNVGLALIIIRTIPWQPLLTSIFKSTGRGNPGYLQGFPWPCVLLVMS